MTAAPDLRLADLLVAISVATDLGMGYEPEKAARSCLLATRPARGLDLTEDEVRDVYLTTLGGPHRPVGMPASVKGPVIGGR